MLGVFPREHSRFNARGASGLSVGPNGLFEFTLGTASRQAQTMHKGVTIQDDLMSFALTEEEREGWEEREVAEVTDAW